MNKKEIRLRVGEGVEIKLLSDKGILDAEQGFGERLLPPVVYVEPEHRESPLFVSRDELEDRERGTAYDATEAQYRGWDVDVDSQPTSHWGGGTPRPLEVRHQLPTEPMCWGIEARD